MPNPLLTNRQLGPDVARANLLTNGGFENWQRGNGPFTAAGAWTADRWALSAQGSDTLSVNKDTANVDAGSGACAAVTFTLGTGAGSTSYNQPIKATDAPEIAGRTLTFSVRIRVATANAVRMGIYNGTAWTYGAFHTGSGVYQTLSATTTFGASGTFYVAVYFAASCTAYIDNAMLVVGSQPANYVPLHPADDLARCLRYYELLNPGAEGPYLFLGQAAGTAAVYAPVLYRVQKPVTPSVTMSAASSFGASNVAMSTQPITSATPSIITRVSCQGAFATSGMTGGSASVILATNGTCQISIEANP